MTVSISEVTPQQAWEGLNNTTGSVLVDVRTKAEWSFVGTPDLSVLGKAPILVEWATLPGMQPNQNFIEGLMTQLGGSAPPEIYFICRSGARSMNAARAVAATLEAQGQSAACINVAEGFEGDLDQARHRGTQNGWKARGLPWTQS